MASSSSSLSGCRQVNSDFTSQCRRFQGFSVTRNHLRNSPKGMRYNLLYGLECDFFCESILVDSITAELGNSDTAHTSCSRSLRGPVSVVEADLVAPNGIANARRIVAVTLAQSILHCGLDAHITGLRLTQSLT
jgi:hypothetical protein